MAEGTCSLCGATLHADTGRGRPRKFCLECRPRKRPLKADIGRPERGGCATCKAPLVDRTQRRCEACKWKTRPRTNCVHCGKPTGWARSDPGGDGASHPRCRPLEHGTRKMYREARCRCDLCRRWSSDSAARHAARHGKWAIPSEDRLALYERDGWTCQLCTEPIDREAHHLQPWAATLDHIVPRSRGGSDDPTNLRTAHRWCNNVRNDTRSYDDEWFAA